MSRHEIPAKQQGFTVAVGCDNPLTTFFAQVVNENADDEDDPVVLWLGGSNREVLRPEDLVAPLAPYADVTAAHLDQLRADRAAGADRGPTDRQRLGARPSWRMP